ncbi:hypothetical protein LCGC14_0570440 [marine sediment metagenome]|uniref:Uncharacterized protein n=1 Tax=marine sediment metagenome TaxID=412755 RepID=A0A0F9S321_9ZZZZ|nr:hypothetical protein [Pricia sp.]
MDKRYAIINIPMDRLHDYSYKAIREFIMENNYVKHLKDILPEIEFGECTTDDDLFKIQMLHCSFPVIDSTQEALTYSIENRFKFTGQNCFGIKPKPMKANLIFDMKDGYFKITEQDIRKAKNRFIKDLEEA